MEIDQLEQMLFFHILQPLAIEELEKIRYKLAEVTVGIEISINEKLQQDVTADIGKLKGLCKTA